MRQDHKKSDIILRLDARLCSLKLPKKARDLQEMLGLRIIPAALGVKVKRIKNDYCWWPHKCATKHTAHFSQSVRCRS
jgi:hypothetical protein